MITLSPQVIFGGNNDNIKETIHHHDQLNIRISQDRLDYIAVTNPWNLSGLKQEYTQWVQQEISGLHIQGPRMKSAPPSLDTAIL